MAANDFLYKREVNKSVLCDGFGIEREYLNIFTRGIGELNRGEKRDIVFIFNNKEYPVIIKNLNNPAENRLNDAYQIRYSANGEFAQSLQATFHRSFHYIQELRRLKEKEHTLKRLFVSIPEEYKEYLAISECISV